MPVRYSDIDEVLDVVLKYVPERTQAWQLLEALSATGAARRNASLHETLRRLVIGLGVRMQRERP